MFKVIGGDGREYGPISTETVRQWIAEGRLSAESRIQAEGGSEWKTLADFAEFTGKVGGGTSTVPPRQASPVVPAVPATPSKLSKVAVTSLVLGLLGFLGVTAIAGLVCGIVAMVQIKGSRGRLRGQGLAVAGTCISGVILVLVVPVAILAGMLLPALARAKDRAQTIMCVNNLKQVGLALRIYAGDNNDQYPSNLLTMTNELGTPTILFCPADLAHPRPTSSSWWGLTTNSISYEFLVPNVYESNVVNTVVVRCPIHGNVCLGDGSVQQGRLGRRDLSGPRNAR